MKKKKFELRRQTLRQLTPEKLRTVVGGNAGPDITECAQTTGDIMTILLSRNVCTDGNC